MNDRELSPQPPAPLPPANAMTGFLAGYFWFIAKNIIGWVLILSSFVLGPFIPGPGGIPLFLLGFALVTFPGKRRFTARVLRGRRIGAWSRTVILLTVILSLVLPAILLRVFDTPMPGLGRDREYRPAVYLMIYLLDVILVWLVIYLLALLANLMLRWMPRVRRTVRPWLHHRGIHLLPPRYRKRASLRHARENRLSPDEILEVHERHHDRLRRLGRFLKPWLRRTVGLALVGGIFYWILKPIVREWPEVSQRLLEVSPARFFMAAGMFSVFLFVFRSTSWRWILRGLGKRTLLAPMTRVWCASELARYLPGVIWQVVGRVYLSKPYGISTGLSSVSQVLELVIFLLANILVAATCLLWFGAKMTDEARPYLLGVMAMIPVLLGVLHPRIFYPLMNRILGLFRKPKIEQRLGGKALIGLVIWAILGLLWQSLAVWVLVSPFLELPLAKWWVVAGAYCLAWSVGFTFGSVTPGGIGVREFVFVKTMQFVLPPAVRSQFADEAQLLVFLKFVSVLLRLWATTGELALAALAHVADLRGALDRPDAPGRISTPADATVPPPVAGGELP